MSCCSKAKIFERKNGKVLHEFSCSNCSGFITVKLDEDLNGAHCVVCPSCQHEHYRIIKDGAITEDRAPSSSKTYAIKIKPTMAAFSKTSWESRMAARKTKLPEDGGKHFINDAWNKMTGKQKQSPPEKKCELEKMPMVKKDEPKEEMIPCPLGLAGDEEIEWYRAKKEDKIKIQDFALAALYRDAERLARENKKLKDAKVAAKKFQDALNKEPVGERCPVHGVVNCITCKIMPKLESMPIALDELIHFAKKNKEAAISLENYEDAIVWRDFEREFIKRRGT